MENLIDTVDINVIINFDRNNVSALSKAVYDKESYDIIKLLIDNGAIVSNLDLGIAIHREIPDTISMLLVDNIKTLTITKWIEAYCKDKKDFVLSIELYEHILKREHFYSGFEYNDLQDHEDYQSMIFIEIMYNYPSVSMMQKFREKGLDITQCTDDEGGNIIDIIGYHLTLKDIEDSVFINVIDYLTRELGMDLNAHTINGRFIEMLFFDTENWEEKIPFLRIDILKYLLENGSTIIPIGPEYTAKDGIIIHLLGHDDNTTEIMEMLKEHGADYSDTIYLEHAINCSAKEDILEYLRNQ